MLNLQNLDASPATPEWVSLATIVGLELLSQRWQVVTKGMQSNKGAERRQSDVMIMEDMEVNIHSWGTPPL
jgi:hypothetical protein